MEIILLNEDGLAVWKHKYNRTLFVTREYSWVDRLVVIDESEEREVVDSSQFSTFDFKDWIPMTVEDYKKVKRKFKDAYDLLCSKQAF